MRKADVIDAINIVKASSLEAAATYADRSISFVMIDASHKYEDVIDDIKAWYPKVKLGGVISGDDYDWESVAKAVNDTIPNVQVYDRTTWFHIKQTITL